YRAALTSAPAPIGAARTKAGSVSAAIVSYYASRGFKQLGANTQVVRRSVLEAFRREHADLLIRHMHRKFVATYLDAMQPSTAKNYLKALRALAQHGIAEGMLDDDPTLGVRLGKIQGDGHHTWTEEELAQFEQYYPLGSRERLAFALGLYSGQRRGDGIRMGRQHIRGGVLYVKQSKTGKALELPVVPELRTVLDLVPTTQLTFLVTAYGKPWGGKSFTRWFMRVCDKAAMPPECTFHGL